MAQKKLGKQTFLFQNNPVIHSHATVAGPKEGKGSFGDAYDKVYKDLYIGQKSFEKAERQMLEDVVRLALKKGDLTPSDMDVLVAGDLLNQITCANFSAGKLKMPFLGIYGACSTFVEGLLVGALFIDGGYAKYLVTATSSHNGATERQFRFPTEYGFQRPPWMQWTVTGAGAVVLASGGTGPKVTHGTVGKVYDMGFSDPMDMGRPMAKAACETIVHHFEDTGRGPEDYDVILTGDLGSVGKALLEKAIREKGYRLDEGYYDCGVLIYRPNQGTQAGGSGCASSALVTLGHFLPKMEAGEVKRTLVVGTGSLHSPTSYQQGETIPTIAHAVAIESN